MTAVYVVCMQCGKSKETERNYIQDHERACKTQGCGAVGQWRKVDWEVATPAFELSVNDRRFLRSLRIAPE